MGVFLLSSVSVAGFGATALLAFLGAVCSITLVYSLARVNGRTPVVALLLAGFAVSTMLSYSSYLLEVLDHDFGTGIAGACILAARNHCTADLGAIEQSSPSMLALGLGRFSAIDAKAEHARSWARSTQRISASMSSRPALP